MSPDGPFHMEWVAEWTEKVRSLGSDEDDHFVGKTIAIGGREGSPKRFLTLLAGGSDVGMMYSVYRYIIQSNMQLNDSSIEYYLITYSETTT